MSQHIKQMVEDFGALIDSEESTFRAHLQDKDLGYLLGLSNLFKMTFNQMVEMRNELHKKAKYVEDPERAEVLKVLEGLYSKLLKVEYFYYLLTDRISFLNLAPSTVIDTSTVQ